MKPNGCPIPRRDVRIIADRNDPRTAVVKDGGKVIFTIKTDLSGMHPSLVVVATETYLKTMAKGKSGIALWNGPVGIAPRNLKLP